MVVAVFQEKLNIADLVRHEYVPFNGYCRDSVLVYNRTTYAVTLNNPLGYPLVVDSSVAGALMLAVAGQEASVVALMLSTKPQTAANNAIMLRSDGGPQTQAVLARGPAILDDASIPALDTHGSAFTLATIVTALKGLNPSIKCNPEPTNQQTQTT